jgi:hypothetical protein
VQAPQYNLDGWVFDGQVHALGVVDAVMYPGTQAFMRWEHPSRLPRRCRRARSMWRALPGAVGFTHGMFNMEFFHDAATDRLTVIEFNPRLASQFGDLYQRVLGLDPHAMSLALAWARTRPRCRAARPAGAAASLVYRAFTPGGCRHAERQQRAALRAALSRCLLFMFPKQGHALRATSSGWAATATASCTWAAATPTCANARRAASALLGWPAPYAECLWAPPAPTPPCPPHRFPPWSRSHPMNPGHTPACAARRWLLPCAVALAGCGAMPRRTRRPAQAGERRARRRRRAM